jgi:hypothetical protein
MRVKDYTHGANIGKPGSVLIFRPRLEEGSGCFLYLDHPYRMADYVLTGKDAARCQPRSSPRRSCYVGLYAKLNDWLRGKGPWLTVSFLLDKPLDKRYNSSKAQEEERKDQ